MNTVCRTPWVPPPSLGAQLHLMPHSSPFSGSAMAVLRNFLLHFGDNLTQKNCVKKPSQKYTITVLFANQSAYDHKCSQYPSLLSSLHREEELSFLQMPHLILCQLHLIR